jgi:hypothetical protein
MQVLDGSQIVRPSLRERAAISELLATTPRPKTLKDADIKYLNDLLNKATWFGFEQRIAHELWTEVNGKEWHDTEATQPPKAEKSPWTGWPGGEVARKSDHEQGCGYLANVREVDTPYRTGKRTPAALPFFHLAVTAFSSGASCRTG